MLDPPPNPGPKELAIDGGMPLPTPTRNPGEGTEESVRPKQAWLELHETPPLVVGLGSAPKKRKKDTPTHGGRAL